MKNLLVSFSGGETSAYMAQWLWNHKQDVYNMVFVFANTGLENEETLEFIEKCSKHFGFKVHWVETKVYHGERKGSGYKVVNYETASRKGEPFEEVILKYGIPNHNYPHCTRELKQAPIYQFADEYFNDKYYSAIGIRQDEADRINDRAEEKRLIYPLISRKMIPATKPMINFYWKMMPFRLNLKGYQGNCITCWKKSDKKLFQIAKENPKAFDFMDSMERKYPLGRDGSVVTFFRKHRSAKDMLLQAETFNAKIKDDANNYDYQLEFPDMFDSCEVFSGCGDEE